MPAAPRATAIATRPATRVVRSAGSRGSPPAAVAGGRSPTRSAPDESGPAVVGTPGDGTAVEGTADGLADGVPAARRADGVGVLRAVGVPVLVTRGLGDGPRPRTAGAVAEGVGDGATVGPEGTPEGLGLGWGVGGAVAAAEADGLSGEAEATGVGLELGSTVDATAPVGPPKRRHPAIVVPAASAARCRWCITSPRPGTAFLMRAGHIVPARRAAHLSGSPSA